MRNKKRVKLSKKKSKVEEIHGEEIIES